METINFYYILTNISNLLRLFTNTPPDLHLQKFLLTQGKLFPKAMLRQTHWAQGMVRNTWPYQVSISLWFQTSAQKLPTLWVCWCKVTNEICLTHLVLTILCNLYNVIFFNMFCDIFYCILNKHCKASLYNGINLFHLSVIWCFSNLLFFLSYNHLHCQTYSIIYVH